MAQLLASLSHRQTLKSTICSFSQRITHPLPYASPGGPAYVDAPVIPEYISTPQGLPKHYDLTE